MSSFKYTTTKRYYVESEAKKSTEQADCKVWLCFFFRVLHSSVLYPQLMMMIQRLQATKYFSRHGNFFETKQKFIVFFFVLLPLAQSIFMLLFRKWKNLFTFGVSSSLHYVVVVGFFLRAGKHFLID
jgi:hypothetical protein